jgi:hypothetical protein
MAEWQRLNFTVEGLDALNIRRPHQILSPCDFWPFDFLKDKLNDR